MMKMRWILVVGLWANVAQAVFPTTQYSYTEPVGLIVKSDFSALAEEVEAIADKLNFTCDADLACVLDVTDIDTSAELLTIITDETGSGKIMGNIAPTIRTPVLETANGVTNPLASNLPSAGVTGRLAVITDGTNGSCTGGGSDLVLCRDNGSAWIAIGGASAGGPSGLGDEPYCMPIDGLSGGFDHKMVVAWPSARSVKAYGCRCNGTCTTPAQLWLEDSAHNAIGTNYVTCSTGNITFTDVTSDSDGDLASGEPLEVFTNNTPVPETDEYLLCVTFE